MRQGGPLLVVLAVIVALIIVASNPNSRLKDAASSESPRAGLIEDIRAGIDLGRQERYEEAVIYFSQLARAYPDEPAAHYNLGLALSAVERFEDARQAFERALELEPEYWDTTAELANLRMLEGDRAGALDLLESVPAGEGRLAFRLRYDPLWKSEKGPRMDALLAKHAEIPETSLKGAQKMDEARSHFD